MLRTRRDGSVGWTLLGIIAVAFGTTQAQVAPTASPRSDINAANRLACHANPCPLGAAPTNVAATSRNAWAVQVEWTVAPWARGYEVERAAAAAGPFQKIHADASCRIGARPLASPAMAMPAPRGATAAPRASQDPRAAAVGATGARGPRPTPRRQFVDGSAYPRSTYFYRTVACYTGLDSLDSPSAVTAAVTTPDAVLTGVIAGAVGTYAAVEWEAPPRPVASYTFMRNGAVIHPDVRTTSPGNFYFYDNFPVSSVAPTVYTVTASFTGGPPGLTVSGTAKAALAETAVQWCRHFVPSMIVTASVTPVSGAGTPPRTFDVVVLAKDSVTGAPVVGTVRIIGVAELGSGEVHGNTGQRLRMPACAKPDQTPDVLSTGTASPSGVSLVGWPSNACLITVDAPGHWSRTIGVVPP